MSALLSLDHWLHDRLIRVRFLAAERECTIFNIFWTKSGTYAVTYSGGHRIFFPWGSPLKVNVRFGAIK
jgi:hypothetical protein